MMKMNLKELIKQKGLSQAKLSRIAEINQGDLCLVLNGKKPFYPGWRKRISEALGMSQEELFPEFYKEQQQGA